MPTRSLLRLALFRFSLSLAGALAAAPLSGCGPLDEAVSAASALETCRGAPYPIVLAHGMAGWDKLGPLNYFFNVANDLRSRGSTVVEARVSPFEPSAVRARQLASSVDETLRNTGACKVVLIGHSQGGLDARYLVSTLGYGDRVAALVTVSTPHGGTKVADAVAGLVPGFGYDLINGLLKAVGVLVGAPGEPNLKAQLLQLTTENMTRRFNPANPDDPRVRYYSVAGRSALKRADDECRGGLWPNTARLDILDPLFGIPSSVFALTSPNPLDPVAHDGLVSVEAARWGRFLGCFPADHLDEIGQIARLFADPFSGYEHKQMYRKIVDQLRADGF
jgi:triacylglycerol lipase